MSNTILFEADFTRFPEAEVVIKNNNAYIDDDYVVDEYWYDAAKHVGVPVENLPAVPGSKVKNYLVFKVLVDVALANVGSDMRQVAEGVTVDQWERKRKIWEKELIKKRAELQSSDVWDENNIPEQKPKNTMIVSPIRG